jgi:hypothetical protein
VIFFKILFKKNRNIIKMGRNFGGLVFLILIGFPAAGLILLLLGCNPNIAGGCPINQVESGTVNQVNVVNTTFYVCSKWCDNDCCEYIESTKNYQVVVEMNYHDGECNYTSIVYNNPEDAYSVASKYEIGNEYDFVVKSNDVCDFDGVDKLFDYWLFGVLTLSGWSLMMVFIGVVVFKENQKKPIFSTNSYQQIP